MEIGKTRVDYKENESEHIRSVKLTFAKMIDHLESQRGDKNIAPISEDKQRLISIAQTKIEEACMFSIKAITRN